jgi:hypothetical protein
MGLCIKTLLSVLNPLLMFCDNSYTVLEEDVQKYLSILHSPYERHNLEISLIKKSCLLR